MSEPKGFIGDAVTAEDWLHNASFQLDNIRGFLMMASDSPEDARAVVWMAAMKADALRGAAASLHSSLVARLAQLEAKGGGL